jgi:hypothetical protein
VKTVEEIIAEGRAKLEAMTPEERILLGAKEELRLDETKPANENAEYFKGRLNIYTCEACRGHIVTRDVDAGVTPFMIRCEATADCKGMMQSSFYRVYEQKMRASHVWYRPSSPQFLSAWEREHVERGGLLLRKATATDPA